MKINIAAHEFLSAVFQQVMGEYEEFRDAKFFDHPRSALGMKIDERDVIVDATENASTALNDSAWGVGIVEGFRRIPYDGGFGWFCACAIVAEDSRDSVGLSSVFQLPYKFNDWIEPGATDDERALDEIGLKFSIETPDKANGLVGLLSKNKTRRIEMIKESCRQALVGFQNEELYFYDW